MAKFSDAKSGAYCTCTRERCSDECRTYRQFRPKPVTNADRIRAMSDKELAEWIEKIRKYCTIEDCGAECPLTDICYSMDASPTRTLEWLNREVAHE